MKRFSKYTIFALLLAVTAFLVTCTKETANVRLDPKLTTNPNVLNVNWDSTTVVGYVVAAGNGFSERGICYNTSATPTVANSKVIYSGSSKAATFTVGIGGLSRLTKYYARAYAVQGSETFYGDEITFSTTAAKPTLADIVASTLTITHDSGVTAKTAISITDDGGPDTTAFISKRGVVYGLYAHPTIDSTKTSEGTGKGQFNSLVLNLKGNKTYYLRAYALNTIGFSYSNEVSFTTPIALGKATTVNPSNVTKTTATLNGLVTYNGGGTISEKGFVYSQSANPTLADTKVTATSSTDTITASITGLSKYTGYHVRAYVTNEAGTYYGADISFKTLADILTWYIPGDYVTASYPGTAYGNWSPGNCPFIMSTIAAGDKLEGYVYMANASNNWKFATQPNWNGPNYGDDNLSGNLNPNASNNITSSAGYYKINADATALTYSAVPTVWGVIGAATASGWGGSDIPLTYNPNDQAWEGGVHLTADVYKFRANNDWGINYGMSAGDASLFKDHDNLSVSAEADYAITLDLSHPNVYTYSANSWGVIGDATPGGWSTDSPMTWDATNKVFTATIALIGSKQFKFRANSAWAVNFGGNGTGDGTADNYTNASTAPLSAGGHNLGVPGGTDGTYVITLNPWSKVATVTPVKKK